MSPIDTAAGLRNTPKGQLQYSPNLNSGKLKLELDQISPPTLSRSHEEKESSKQNLSFGLDPAEFPRSPNSSADYNENCAYISEVDDAGHFISKRDSFKQNIRFGLDPSEFQSSPGTSTDFSDNCGIRSEERCLNNTGKFTSKCEEKADANKEDKFNVAKSPLMSASGLNVQKKTPVRSPASCPVSPEFGYTSCAIVDAKKQYELLSQMSLSKRQAEFEHHDRSLNYLMDHKESEMLSRLTQQTNHRQIQIDKKLQEGLEEGYKRRQRLKEDHEEHLKKINTKQKEIERKRELLKEEERRRKEKIAKLHRLWEDIDNNRQSFIQQCDGFKYRSSLPEVVSKYRAVLENVCTSRAAQIQDAENLQNVDELITKFEEDKAKSFKVLSILQKQVEETEQKVKAEEDQQKELEKRKADQAADAKRQQDAIAQDFSVQSMAFILQEYDAKSKELARVEAGIQSFIENARNKAFRFTIQRVVNTPINAISDYSGPHLMDKLKRLKDLLSGQKLKELLHEHNAKSPGNSIPESIVPEALLFCQNLIAKMLVKKGEEQVTSKHESAFPIGAVVVALWEEFPIVGELFLAHLQALCPYVLPMYFSHQKDQSSQDYHKSLGYKVSEDGTIEEQDKFLRRMSGLMRLYCSCMVSHLPPGINSPHPHGLDNAWKWLARTMNLDPRPDITAAMIYDVLSVTGHALFKEYRVQFAKLLHLLYRSYLPNLESVSVTSATLGRLKIFLETSMQNASIPPPEGLLPQDFYFKSPDPVS